MKKILRTFFSRFSLIAISVLLQIVIIFICIEFLLVDYVWFYIASLVISFALIVTLPFRSMPAEGKITWLLLILVLPPFGAILYIMFSKNFISNRQKKMYNKMEEKKDRYNTKKDDYENVMKKKMPIKYYGQMEYIYSCNRQIGFTNTKTEFYSSGEKYFDSLLTELKKAEKFIFMEFFIIEPGKFFDSIVEVLEEKVKKGVDVRLIFDDLGSMTKVPFNYYKYLTNKGIKVVKFNRFVPIVSAVHNNRDHRKIVVIDGNVGFTGGINLADEYINVTHPFGHWKDTGIKLVGQAVDELTIMFLTNYNLQRRKIESTSKYLNQFDYVEHDGIVVPYGDGPRPVYQEYVGENVYLNMINQAERYIWITTPYLIIDGKMKTALQNAASRGVDVRIVTPHIPDKKLIFMITRSSYESLQKYGVKIYEYKPGFIHAKQVLCDDDVGIIGTINFDYRSLLHHYENAVWMYKSYALIDMKEDFKEIFASSYNMKDYKQNRIIHFLCKVGEVFQPLL